MLILRWASRQPKPDNIFSTANVPGDLSEADFLEKSEEGTKWVMSRTHVTFGINFKPHS